MFNVSCGINGRIVNHSYVANALETMALKDLAASKNFADSACCESLVEKEII